MEKIFVGTTVALDGITICGPVEIGDEGVMGFANTYLVIVISLDREDVNFIVMGSNC